MKVGTSKLKGVPQNKDNETGWACGTYGERGGAYRALVGRSEGKNHLEDVRIDGRILLERIF
jgi:hypothetical protein